MSKFSVYCPDYLFPHEESSQIKKKTQEWSLRSRNSSRNHHSHFYLYYEKAVESKKNDLHKEALERGVVVYLPEISCGGRPTTRRSARIPSSTTATMLSRELTREPTKAPLTLSFSPGGQTKGPSQDR